MLNYKSSKKYRLNEETPAEDNTGLSFVIQSNATTNTVTDNKIYLIGDITRDSVFNIIKQIDELSKQLKLLQFTYDLHEVPHIKLGISSDGGCLSSSLLLADKIITNKISIDTYVEGVACSGASLISIVGKKRYITPNSMVLLHQLSTGNWGGTYENLSDEKQNCDLLMKMLKNIYLKYTKFKSKELNELLKHDLILSSDECIHYGVCDAII